MSNIARIVRSNGTEAVQLPPGYRFDGDMVQVRRDGAAVILEPVGEETGPSRSDRTPSNANSSAASDADWASFPRLPDDLADEILAVVETEVPHQERPELEALFK